MIERRRQSHLADASQRHHAFAVLSRFFSVRWLKLPFRTWNNSEVVLHELQRLLLIELTRDYQNHVVGLIILLIKTTQVIGWNLFDICTVADCCLAVIVPFKRRRRYALHENSLRTIFTAFKFAADHRKFFSQIFCADETVHKPIRFQLQCELEVLVAGRQSFVVVGAVKPGRSVELRSSFLQ